MLPRLLLDAVSATYTGMVDVFMPEEADVTITILQVVTMSETYHCPSLRSAFQQLIDPVRESWLG